VALERLEHLVEEIRAEFGGNGGREPAFAEPDDPPWLTRLEGLARDLPERLAFGARERPTLTLVRGGLDDAG
jgi:hypothetical protein